MAKRLYAVTVETEMVVFAEDRADAEALARRHVREECASDPFSFVAHELTDLRLIDDELLDTLPWGGSGGKTVRELFAEEGKK